MDGAIMFTAAHDGAHAYAHAAMRLTPPDTTPARCQRAAMPLCRSAASRYDAPRAATAARTMRAARRRDDRQVSFIANSGTQRKRPRRCRHAAALSAAQQRRLSRRHRYHAASRDVANMMPAARRNAAPLFAPYAMPVLARRYAPGTYAERRR